MFHTDISTSIVNAVLITYLARKPARRWAGGKVNNWWTGAIYRQREERSRKQCHPPPWLSLPVKLIMQDAFRKNKKLTKCLLCTDTAIKEAVFEAYLQAGACCTVRADDPYPSYWMLALSYLTVTLASSTEHSYHMDLQHITFTTHFEILFTVQISWWFLITLS